MTIPETLLLIGLLLILYSYVLYPITLYVWGRIRPYRIRRDPPTEWPRISITIPVFNEAGQMADLLESVLSIDYPPDRRQIVVVSDASTDGTDEVVRSYAPRGVELIRQPERRGKTAAENAARQFLTGDIVVNTDASIRIERGAVKALIACFQDPSVGVASGRDVSVARVEEAENRGEAGYVGYEMWVRRLETRVFGIVGASGCFYAIRPHLHQHVLPEALSRDFASALVARRAGFRAVSVDEAICYVPRTATLQREYSRKVRTITRGMETLWFQRTLLNPIRYGVFSWMLFSHKVCRWLTPWGAILIAASVPFLMPQPWGVVTILTMLAAAIFVHQGIMRGWLARLPRFAALPSFLLASNAAVIHATLKSLGGDLNPIWDPTPRNVVSGAGDAGASVAQVRQ